MKRSEGHYSRSDSGEKFRQSRAVDSAGNPREPTRRAPGERSSSQAKFGGGAMVPGYSKPAPKRYTGG
jgi:hypothetical protein